jgi:hypothetical protein
VVSSISLVTPHPSQDHEERHARRWALWVTVLGIIALVLLGGLITYLVLSYHNSFKPYRFEKDALTDEIRDLDTGEVIAEIPVDEIFSPERVAAYENGSGFSVEFITRHDPSRGYRTTTKSFGLDKYSYFQQKVKSVRTSTVKKTQEDFRAAADAFRKHQPVEVSPEIYVDNTAGISRDLRNFTVSTIEKGFGLTQRVKQGDTVHMLVTFISDVDYLRPVLELTFAPGMSLAERQEQDRELSAFLHDQPPKAESKIASGLFNQLRENTRRRNRFVLIVTDGIENSPLLRGYSPEGLATFVAAGKEGCACTDFDKQMTSEIPMPDLRNVYKIALYAPPTDELRARPELEKNVRAALKAWDGLFVRALTAAATKAKDEATDCNCPDSPEMTKSKVEVHF